MTIKKLFFLLLITILACGIIEAKNFTKKASIAPILVQKGSQKNWCPLCGMSIKMFYKTSYTAKLKNNTPRQYCSMRCLVMDMQEYGIDMKSVKVVDAQTQKLIDAQKAFLLLTRK